MPRSPTPSNTPSVWVDALCAWPTLTRCPTQASGIPFSDIVSDIVSDIAASLRGRQLRLQHSEAFALQHLGGPLVAFLCCVSLTARRSRRVATVDHRPGASDALRPKCPRQVRCRLVRRLALRRYGTPTRAGLDHG